MSRLQDDPRWARAVEADAHGQAISAELLYGSLLSEHPAEPALVRRLARLANMRGDPERAVVLLGTCAADRDEDGNVALELAQSLAAAGRPADAERTLETLAATAPDHTIAWLVLGRLREIRGDAQGSLKAWYQAVVRSQRNGRWRDLDSTPPQWRDLIVRAIERVREGRRELFLGAYDALRTQHGAGELQRVDRALTGWMREWDSTPSDPRQRPRFFYFPGLPDGPYHDPMLQPWARQLAEAFPAIRAEALSVTGPDRTLPNFIDPAEGGRGDEYVDGEGPAPSWKAFFFYRHGERLDDNHARCPKTSAVLEALPLCRIHEEAPEILFSVLAPGTHIKPHHGVSNVRLVMHLPLVVPPNCALRLVDHGDHAWEEGRLVMFDDTFLHEAWNRSDRTRLVLLMDCWNPHLSALEQVAVKQLIETISGLHLAAKPRVNGQRGGGVMQD
jgi:aspartate beta-hydroxylase